MSNKALKQGEDLALSTIFRYLGVGILKVTAGLVSGITVVWADAISTFAHTLGAFAAYLGFKLSRRGPDNKFSFGYYKTETFAAFLISLGIIYLGSLVAAQSIDIINTPSQGSHRPFAITTTIFSIVLAYNHSKTLKQVGTKINSLSLVAIANDKRSDVFIGLAVLASIYANFKGIPYFEGAVTLLLAVIILKDGIQGAKESLFFLLDYWDDPKLRRKISRLFSKEKDMIAKVKKIKLRRAGTFIFGEAFIEINPFNSLRDLREELEILTTKVKEISPYIKDFAIHTHIPKVKKIRVAMPIKKGRSLRAEVANSMRETTAYLFVDIRKGRVSQHYAKKVPNKQNSELAEFLKKEKVNILIDNRINSLLYYQLMQTYQILIYPNFADIKTARETIKLILLET